MADKFSSNIDKLTSTVDKLAHSIDKLTNQVDKLTGLYEGLRQEAILTNGAVSRIENERLPAIERELKAVGNKLDEHMRQPVHA